MLELIVSPFQMKNDVLGIFSLKTISISQNYPLKMHNIITCSGSYCNKEEVYFSYNDLVIQIHIFFLVIICLNYLIIYILLSFIKL